MEKHGIGRRKGKTEKGKRGRKDRTKGSLPGSVALAAERQREKDRKREGEETQRDR